MSNRKIEGTPRSELFLRAMVYQPLLAEPGSFYPIINEESLKLARFFAEEERLAALISEPKTVDKDTIYAVVVTARKIAAKGYSTNLVPLDEMLDLAQIYISATDPEVAANLLVELLSNIKETGNTAWTARVAAALAYFSNLQGQALQD